MSTTYIQKRIISVAVTSLLAAGFTIDVNDNDGDRETHLKSSADHAAIMAAIFNPELDSADYTLDVIRGRTHFGWVRLIDGNGAVVITDYTTNLEEVLKPANALADKIDAGEEAWIEAELAAKDKFRSLLQDLYDTEERLTGLGRSAIRELLQSTAGAA